MPRYHLYHQPTGTLLARDLYPHRYPWLRDRGDCHDFLPVGSYLIENPNAPVDAYAHPPGTLFLGRETLVQLPRGPWNGCCGPMGNLKNILSPDEQTAIAWEYADCHQSHCVEVEPEEYELKPISEESGVCWVAWISYRGPRRLLRAAYGRDETEVKKRLRPAAQARLEYEASIGSQPGEVLNAPIEMQSVEDFAHLIKFDPNTRDAEVTWLARKYSTA